jgi:hypothetical protein
LLRSAVAGWGERPAVATLAPHRTSLGPLLRHRALRSRYFDELSPFVVTWDRDGFKLPSATAAAA